MLKTSKLVTSNFEILTEINEDEQKATVKFQLSMAPNAQPQDAVYSEIIFTMDDSGKPQITLQSGDGTVSQAGIIIKRNRFMG